MNLFILCVATILANNWAVANPGDDCGTQYCGAENFGTQNCGTQNCDNNCNNNCNNGLFDSGVSQLEDDVLTSVAFTQFGITSDDILPYPPNASLQVIFNTARCNFGNNIQPSETILPPYVIFPTADPKRNYTLLAVDVDYPSASTPLLRFLVGLTINIPGSSLEVRSERCGDEVGPWVGPAGAPGTGPHRVIIVLFEQSDYIDPYDRTIAEVSAIRIKFKLQRFINIFNLNLVAGNFWTFCVPDDYCTVCDRNKPYRLYRNDGFYANNGNLCLSARSQFGGSSIQ